MTEGLVRRAWPVRLAAAAPHVTSIRARAGLLALMTLLAVAFGPAAATASVPGAIPGATQGAALVPAYPLTAAETPSPEGRITQIRNLTSGLEIVFTADGMRPDEVLDPQSVTVAVGDTPVAAQARPLEPGDRVARRAVLAIDVSGSMMGEPIAAAKRAAIRFIDAVPADVDIGLLAFGSEVTNLVAATPDREVLRAQIEQLEASGRGTLLYDAVIRALGQLSSADVRSVLVLSDGDDAGSDASLAEASSAVAAANTPLDVIALGEFENFIDPLKALAASSTSGRVLLAPSPADLSALFGDAASAIANQVVINAELPAGIQANTVNVTVSGLAGSVRVSDTVAVSLLQEVAPAAPPRVVERPAIVVGKAGYLIGMLGVFVALALGALVVGGVAAQAGASPNRAVRNISMYTLSGQNPRLRTAPTTTSLGDGTVTRSAVGLADRVVASRGLDVMLAKQLELAGVPLRPGEWLILHASTASGLGVLCVLLSGGSLLVGILGVAVGFAGPPLYLNLRAERRRTAFATQLPDTLQLLAGSLSAGYSLAQAVDTVVREGQEPLATEFGRALSATRLGVPIEDALEATASRMGSTDFAWVVMAIRIQRDVGGNLSELLRTVADTLRERDFLKRQVSAMSAEGRLSAIVLLALPPVFAIILAIARPNYVLVLVRNPIGIAMIAMGLALLAVGVVWLRRIVDVKT